MVQRYEIKSIRKINVIQMLISLLPKSTLFVIIQLVSKKAKC